MQATRLFTAVLVFSFISATADLLSAQNVVSMRGTSAIDSMVSLESPTTEDPIVINLAADGITYTTDCEQLSAFGGSAFDIIVDEPSRTINISVTGTPLAAGTCRLFLFPDPVNGIRCSVGRLAAGDWEVQTSFPGASPPSSTFGETLSFTVTPAPTRPITHVPLYTFQGGSVSEFGQTVSGAGDVNGDGTPDLIVGPARSSSTIEAGIARVFSGRDGSVLYDFEGERSFDDLGESVGSAGDVNGDGFADVIVGASKDDNSRNGRARVFSGSDGSVLFNFDGDGRGDWFGFSVSGAGDVNGDGTPDLIVGTGINDVQFRLFFPDTPENLGYARVFSGVDGSVLYNFDGDSMNDFFGHSVSGAGDVNGDGFADLIVGASRSGDNGRARVFSGSDGSVLFSFDGVSPGDGFGRAVSGAGDVNGDGFADLIVGAQNSNNSRSSARVFSGSDGSVLYDFYGDRAFDGFGFSVSGAGDVNGDGFADVIVGTGGEFNSVQDHYNNYVRVFSGVDGRALYTFSGVAGTTGFGWSVSGAGDLNGDGLDDFIVGAREGDNGIGFARVFVSQISSSPLLGDVDLSGAVDFLDINPFISVLISGTYQREADFNTDGMITLLDIAPFVVALTGQ